MTFNIEVDSSFASSSSLLSDPQAIAEINAAAAAWSNIITDEFDNIAPDGSGDLYAATMSANSYNSLAS
jgi:pyridoxal/pyridoxine/pyridoxamine kinase